MTATLKYQYEILALKIMYPHASAKRIRKFMTLAKKKNIKIVGMPTANDALDNLMCSIIRHEDSQYEHILHNGLSRENARGLISPIVKQKLVEIKGGM